MMLAHDSDLRVTVRVGMRKLFVLTVGSITTARSDSRFSNQNDQSSKEREMNRKPNPNFYRVRFDPPSVNPPPTYYRQRTTWRIDWVGSIIGTIILTASVA